MCGIFGYIGKKDQAKTIVINGLKILEYRGYDSWGVASIEGNDLEIDKHVGKIGEYTVTETTGSNMAIGHTRWATHGGVTVENAHPHTDTERQIAVVHNGIIENYQELKKELIKKDFRFNSETDTEVFAFLIADYLKTLSFTKAVQTAFDQCQGLNAFVVLHRETEQIIALRKGSPLVIGKTADGFVIASDSTALAVHTDQMYFVEDDEMIVVSKSEVKRINDQKYVEIKWETITFDSEDLSLGHYEHFMMKEIGEQPKVLQTILHDSIDQINTYAKHLRKFNYFVGCGTAYNASLVAEYYLANIAKLKSRAIAGSEFGTFLPTVTQDDMVTFLSQSGETIDIVEHATSLNESGRNYGAIVNRIGSTLQRMSERSILLNAGPEQCVLATKSFTAKIAVLFLLAHAKNNSLEDGKEQLAYLIKWLPEILTEQYQNEFIIPTAKKLAKHSTLFVIGRGISYPTALEASLKIKEVTYIHTEGIAGGELKHGVIALIEKGTPCIVLAPSDETYDAMVSNAMELKSRGAYIIGVAEKPNEVFDVCIPVKTFRYLSVISISIVIQLLAYHTAIILGNDPDKPRNLAKSVTVR